MKNQLMILPKKTISTRSFVRADGHVSRNLIMDVVEHTNKMDISQLVNVMDMIGCTNAKAQHSTGSLSMLDLECYYGTMKKGRDVPVYFYGGALQAGQGSSFFEMVEGTASDWVADCILYQVSQADEGVLMKVGLC